MNQKNGWTREKEEERIDHENRTGVISVLRDLSKVVLESVKRKGDAREGMVKRGGVENNKR